MGNEWGKDTARHRGRSEWAKIAWAVLAIVWFEVKMYAGLVPWEYILLGVGFAVIVLIGSK